MSIARKVVEQQWTSIQIQTLGTEHEPKEEIAAAMATFLEIVESISEEMSILFDEPICRGMLGAVSRQALECREKPTLMYSLWYLACSELQLKPEQCLIFAAGSAEILPHIPEQAANPFGMLLLREFIRVSDQQKEHDE